MSLPLNKREFDLFLSHAHRDSDFVSQLYRWLSDKAGFRVWYDKLEMAGGALLATDLQAALERCRGALLVVAAETLKQGWVRAEYNAAMDERANNQGFRVIALRVAKGDVEGLMRGTTWIDVPEPRLDPDTALAMVRALYPGDKEPIATNAQDIFVSRSWHEQDGASARAVCRVLAKQGFRLIGDAKDQRGFGRGDRVEHIIASCGAFVGILPYRGVESARADDKPYKYFLQELDYAARLDLPMAIVADPRVSRVDGSDAAWLRMDTTATECPPAITSALTALGADWSAPPAPQYIFCALDLESDAARPSSSLRNMIERITGMRTIVGNEIHEQPLQSAIIRSICGAFLVLADITDDNLNTCIEAGMGLAAGTNVEILARGKPRRPPFMLQGLQMVTYADDSEQIGILHRILYPYRRRVVNAEL
jgi:hypothetical protein